MAETKRRPWKIDGKYPTKPCQICGVDVEVTERARWERTKFCSTSCRGKGSPSLFKPGHPNLVPASSRGCSEETRRKISETQRANDLCGERHPNYRNGQRTERKREMQSWQYRDWRTAVFARDGYQCQMCGIKGTYFHADHIVAWKVDESLRYDVANGRTLCYECHYEVTFGRKGDPETMLRWGVPAKHRDNVGGEGNS